MVRLSVVRFEFDRTIEIAQRIGVAFQDVIRKSAAVVEERRLGQEREGATEISDGLGGLAQVVMRNAPA